MKIELICPYCGFVSTHFDHYFVDGDLICCSVCNGLIDVVGTNDYKDVKLEKHTIKKEENHII